ncbi:unnamed protein product, partial [Urochloa humidicola]
AASVVPSDVVGCSRSGEAERRAGSGPTAASVGSARPRRCGAAQRGGHGGRPRRGARRAVAPAAGACSVDRLGGGGTTSSGGSGDELTRVGGPTARQWKVQAMS